MKNFQKICHILLIVGAPTKAGDSDESDDYFELPASGEADKESKADSEAHHHHIHIHRAPDKAALSSSTTTTTTTTTKAPSMGPTSVGLSGGLGDEDDDAQDSTDDYSDEGEYRTTPEPECCRNRERRPNDRKLNDDQDEQPGAGAEEDVQLLTEEEWQFKSAHEKS